MQHLELEKTYLAKYLPSNLIKCDFIRISDIYIPVNREHSELRVRSSNDKYEITKKIPLDKNDFSKQTEHTIFLDKEEYMALITVSGKKVEKTRYYYIFQGRTAEIDVFEGSLSGLVLVDFEFETIEELEQFRVPNFCLVDVTQEEFTAGGKLCGKTYSDIESELRKFSYTKLKIK